MVTDKATWTAVADGTRRAILDRLTSGPHSVTDLAEPFSISRPAVSKHLRILLEADLVAERRQGRNRIYALNPGPLREVDHWLERYRRFWTVNLLNLKHHVETRKGGQK